MSRETALASTTPLGVRLQVALRKWVLQKAARKWVGPYGCAQLNASSGVAQPQVTGGLYGCVSVGR